MGLLKRNNPPYDTFLFRSAARPNLKALPMAKDARLVILPRKPKAEAAEQTNAEVGQ
jgi:hypothetical protein